MIENIFSPYSVSKYTMSVRLRYFCKPLVSGKVKLTKLRRSSIGMYIAYSKSCIVWYNKNSTFRTRRERAAPPPHPPRTDFLCSLSDFYYQQRDTLSTIYKWIYPKILILENIFLGGFYGRFCNSRKGALKIWLTKIDVNSIVGNYLFFLLKSKKKSPIKHLIEGRCNHLSYIFLFVDLPVLLLLILNSPLYHHLKLILSFD